MTKRQHDAVLTDLLTALAPKAKSLIVTVFGDAILPRGGTCWLGSLIDVVQPLGLGDRIVRTSVFRLIKEGWLTATPVGRRSLYAVTETGRHRFATAEGRIYGVPDRTWGGEWTFALANERTVAGERRDALSRQMQWMGFGIVGPTMFAHPSADLEGVRSLLADSGLAGEVVVFRGAADGQAGADALRAITGTLWDLDGVAADYQIFIQRFRPVYAALSGMDSPPAELCLTLRILLIHDYRRVVLRDPQLPEALLPDDWAGTAAWRLCRDLYHLTQGPAERHLDAVLHTADGPAPAPAPRFFARFGGKGSDGPPALAPSFEAAAGR